MSAEQSTEVGGQPAGTEVELEAAGIPFRIRVRPAPHPTGELLVWLHGGAFMFGTIDMPEAEVVAVLLAEAGVGVVSVDYTLAPLDALAALPPADPGDGVPTPQQMAAEAAAAGPRARFPVASQQAAAAFEWTVAHAAELGGRPGAVAIGGASAGGNLAAGAALRLRDRGGAQPSAVLLAYPVLHVVVPPASPALLAELEGLPAALTFPDAAMAAINANYARDESDRRSPYAFPAGHDLTDLPPTLIVTAGRDRLRPSGEGFAAELALAGVDVALAQERGVPHGFLNEVGDPAAARTIQRFVEALRAVAETGSAPPERRAHFTG